MEKFRNLWLLPAVALLGAGCGVVKENAFSTDESKLWTIGQELSFFSKYSVDAQVLKNDESVLIFSPTYHGRIFTSAFGDESSPSLGWFNRELVALKNRNLRTAFIGGEDALFVGPEGGDASVYFDRGALWTEENRKLPEIVSTNAWKMVSRSDTRARFEARGELTNALGTKFSISVEREISLLSRDDVSKILGVEIPQGLKLVAFQSMNKLTNTSDKKWTEKTGMLNMSVKSCFNANKTVYAFVPYRAGDASEYGDVVRDNVFDSATSASPLGDRISIFDDYIRFKCDGRHISGIGVNSRRSEGIAFSYDDKNAVLTIVLYIKPSGRRAYYPASWRNAQTGFDGEAISVYNNGPASRNIYFSNLFYEIATYSPALDLDAGRSQFHLQRTFHFHGSEYDLDLLAYKLTGVSLKQMRVK